MTPMFPGWHLPTLRRKPRTEVQKLMDLKEKIHTLSFSRLGQCLERYIPSHFFGLKSETGFSRRRIFSLDNTFWGFFHQVLSNDGGCQEIVNQFRVLAKQRGLTKISPSTSAYCQARKKLDIKLLEKILTHTQNRLPVENSTLPLVGRRVVVADGTGISMADTPVNQREYPQPKSQRSGCGFPQARICALFDLNSGVALSYRMGNKKSHELPLFREQMSTFVTGDIFLGDKGFTSYFDMQGLKIKGVDSVVGLAKRKPICANEAKIILSDNDLIVEWPKPKGSKTRYEFEEWKRFPDSFLVRQIKVTVNQPGFRVKSFYIATTLLDEKRYPAKTIEELYLKRWNVELYFRELKTTLGLDILRCKTPDMIHKEVIMYFIVYNTLKLMIKDSLQNDVQADEMSFNSCRQVLNKFSSSVVNHSLRKCDKSFFLADLKNILCDCRLFKRFGRVEPRVQKRRPKPFKLLMKPRAELKAELMRVTPPQIALT